jgi:hypothetical protein
MNEILRLRIGCIRWQREDIAISQTEESVVIDSVCFIDIPVNKTSTEYMKPVDRQVGAAGYFARYIRAVEVLIDQDSVRSGTAANEPWKF